MQEAETLSLEQIRAFLESSVAIRFAGEKQQQVYEWIERFLRHQEYHRQNRGTRGLLRRYIGKMTGRSRAQVTRLIGRYRDTGKIAGLSYQRHRFPRRYTEADVELLAVVDEAHETLSGPPLLLMLPGLFTVRLPAKRFGDSAWIDETRPILMAGRDRLTAVSSLTASSRRRMEQFDKAFGRSLRWHSLKIIRNRLHRAPFTPCSRRHAARRKWIQRHQPGHDRRLHQEALITSASHFRIKPLATPVRGHKANDFTSSERTVTET